MINRTVIVGRLTAKPEAKKTNNGKSLGISMMLPLDGIPLPIFCLILLQLIK